METITRETASKLSAAARYGPHDRFVTCVALSEQYIATGAGDGVVKVWPIGGGGLAERSAPHRYSITHLRFGPTTDNVHPLIAADSSGSVQLLHIRGERLVTEYGLQLPRMIVLDVAFLPDGRALVAASYEGHVRILDLRTGREVFTLPLSNADAPHGAFSEQGDRFAMVSAEGRMHLWDTSTWETLAPLKLGVAARMLRFAATDTRLVLLQYQSDAVWVLDAHSGAPAGRNVNVVFASGAALSPDGTLLAVPHTQKDGPMSLFDVESGEEVHRINGGGPATFSPDGLSIACGDGYAQQSKYVELLTTSEDTLPTLDAQVAGPIGLAGLGALRVLRTLSGHQGVVNTVAFAPDGETLASGGADRTVWLWNVVTGEERAVLHGHNAEVTAVAFSPTGGTLASGSGYFGSIDDNTVRLWDVSSGKPMYTFFKHLARVTAVAFAGEDHIASADADGTVYVWEVSTGDVIHTLKHASPVNGLAAHHDLVAVAVGGGKSGDTNVYLWRNGDKERTLDTFRDWAQRVTFNDDGTHVYAVDYSNRLCGWDVATGDLVLDAPGGVNLAASHDDMFIAVALDKTVKLVPIHDPQDPTRVRNSSNVLAVAFSEYMLAAALQDGTVAVWGLPVDSKAITQSHERVRLEQTLSGRHTFSLVKLVCTHAQESGGDEPFIRVDGRTIWRITDAGRTMHHDPTRPKEVDTYNFRDCTVHDHNGWHPAVGYQPEDFVFTGLTGDLSIELWEADLLLRGGDDYLGGTVITLEKADQGEVEMVIYKDGATYVLTYEVTAEAAPASGNPTPEGVR